MYAYYFLPQTSSDDENKTSRINVEEQEQRVIEESAAINREYIIVQYVYIEFIRNCIIKHTRHQYFVQ